MNEAIPAGDEGVDTPLHIDFLYWDGCPSHEQALQLLYDVLEEEQIFADVHLQQIETHEEVERLRFPGSPTIRVEGLDIDPNDTLPLGLACRVYTFDGRTAGVPSREMIVAAVRGARRGHA